MARRLTKAQKAKNRAEYNRIRRAYNKTDKSITYVEFKRIVKSRAEAKNESIKEAAEKTAHSYLFTNADTVGKENILSSLKEKFRGTYDELRRKAGRFSKGQKLIDKLEWDDDRQAYILESSTGDTYLIDISNSPEQATLIEL